MSEARTTALTLTAAVAAVGLIARSMGGGAAAAVERAGNVSAPAAQEAKKADASLAPPDRYQNMGMRLLGLSMGRPEPLPLLTDLPDTALAVTVATIPDPVDSHADWAYDAFLESLRRAHEQAGYVVDRMWLPWTTRADSVVADTVRSRVREAYPGVLLFRSPRPVAAVADTPRYRLLYLVGEIPTAGVHPHALQRALDERDLLLGRYPGGTRQGVADTAAGKAKEPVDTLRVIGPSFSGSARGLATVLSQWRNALPGRAVRIATGSATGSSNRAVFTPAAGFDFISTVNSDEDIRNALHDALPGLGVKPEELAVLVEGSTAYGREWDTGTPAASKPSPPSAAAPATKIEEPPPGVRGGLARHATSPRHPAKVVDESKGVGIKALVLSFPMNIGTLRDDYADQLRARRRAQDDPGTALPLSLTDAARPNETPPVTSRLTAASVDLILDQIAGTLRDHNIRAVAIASSNVRDRIFLASELRNRLRDVHFIALENHALYLTPEYNRDLRGMVVISTYPLMPETQLWGSDLEVVPFSSEYAEGVYNATLLQLGAGQLLDYAYPDGRPGLHRPPLWISTVGTSELVPLRADTSANTSANRYVTAVASGRVPRATLDPRLDFMTGVLLIGILVVSAWFLFATLSSLLDLPRGVRADLRLFERQERGLRWTEGLARAAENGTLSDAQLERIRVLSGVLRSAHDTTLTREECEALRELPRTVRGGMPVTALQLRALETVEGRWTALRRGRLLSRKAEWGGLRYQEAMYRMVFGVAVFGGLMPGTLMAAEALQQVVRTAAGQPGGATVSPALSLAVMVAGLLLLAGAAVTGALQARRHGTVWRGVAWLCAAALAIVGAGAWASPKKAQIAAVAVALCIAAGAVLVAGVIAAGVSLGRWIAQYYPAFRQCQAERHRRVDLWRLNLYARRAVLGSALLFLGLTVWYALDLAAVATSRDPVPFALLFHRGWRLDGGMSPIVPLLLAAASFAAWSRWHLRRVRAQRDVTAFEAAALELDATVEPGAGARDGDELREWATALPRRAVVGVSQVRDRLSRLIPDAGAAILALGLALACGCVVASRYRAVEHLAGFGWSFDALYRFGMIGMVATTAWAVYRLLAVWSGLHRTLRAMSGTPLITAFERLPRRVARLTRLAFVGAPRSSVVEPVAATQWRHLKALSEALVAKNAVRVMKVYPPPAVPVPAGGGPVAEQASEGAARIHGALIVPPIPTPAAVEEQDLRDGVLAYAALDQPATGLGRWGQEETVGGNFLQLAGVLQAYWDREPGAAEVAGVQKQLEKAESGQGPSTSGRIRRTTGDELSLWVRAAEEFAAVQVVDYLESVIDQMRVLAMFVFASLILVTLHAGAYPYEPQSLMKLVLFALLAVTVGALVKVMVEMNRDDVLSRIAHTEPGKITWDLHFVMNLVLFGLVPLVSLIGSEFPAVREFLLAWVYPITRLAGGGG